MGKLIDLTGQKFGYLTVIERDKDKQDREVNWKCRCICGNIISTRGTSLRKGLTKSCGCQKKLITKEKLSEDLTNEIFGELKVLSLDTNNSNKGAYWLCQCSCGNIKSIAASSLKSGKTKSCGCKTASYISQSLSKELKQGDIFGKWRVIRKDNDNLGDGSRYICQCDCGITKSVKTSSLLDGSSLSCGCMHSAGEWKLSQILQQLNYHIETQYSFDNLCGDYNPLRFDFAVLDGGEIKCLIEYQGEQHYKSKDFFDEKLSFSKRQEYDEKKRQYCKERGIKLVEIPYWDYDKLDINYVKSFL